MILLLNCSGLQLKWSSLALFVCGFLISFLDFNFRLWCSLSFFRCFDRYWLVICSIGLVVQNGWSFSLLAGVLVLIPIGLSFFLYVFQVWWCGCIRLWYPYLVVKNDLLHVSGGLLWPFGNVFDAFYQSCVISHTNKFLITPPTSPL